MGQARTLLKAQGLITMLCRAHLVRCPTSIYVGLDTARDYVYVDDAARMAVVGTDRVSAEEPGAVVVKIIASQTGTTVAAIMGELRTDHQAPTESCPGFVLTGRFPGPRPDASDRRSGPSSTAW